MQCLRIWFAIWLFVISVNNSVASPVVTLNVDNKNVGDLNVAESNQDDAVISERDNEVGYLRKQDEKGADAYQHFESFHDKDGDAYGYEKHEAYGKSNKGESLNDEKGPDEGSHYTYVQELGDKPKYQKYQGSVDDPGKSNYHYSYNSEDDDETKPNYSSSYKQEQKDDSSDEDDAKEDENDVETDDNGSDEEKSTNFSYKIISDDYEEDDANGDVNSKGSDNGSGYNFGHGNKNTDVNYNVKKSDYTVGDDDNDDQHNEDDDNESSEEEEEEEEGENNVIAKDQKSDDDQGKDKNTKSYSTYTTYSSQEGDEDDGDSDSHDESIPKYAVRYEAAHPLKKQKNSSIQKVDDGETEDSEENHESTVDVQANSDVELHQPTKPAVLVKEHRAGYQAPNDPPKSIPTKPQVIIQPSKPILIQQQHHGEYKTEESDGDKGSDESGKGHAGSVTKHLYEIYVTHDTGKSNGGGGGGGGGDSKGSDDAGGNGKSENLVLEQPQKPKNNADVKDNGTYKVKINYGNKKGLKKNGKKVIKKHKGSPKKVKIIKPNKYEVEEYIDNEEEKKQPIVAGKASSPHHHRDSDDYSSGQQFLYASEADSDAYYW